MLRTIETKTQLLSGVSICTFVLVKQVNSVPLDDRKEHAFETLSFPILFFRFQQIFDNLCSAFAFACQQVVKHVSS